MMADGLWMMADGLWMIADGLCMMADDEECGDDGWMGGWTDLCMDDDDCDHHLHMKQL